MSIFGFEMESTVDISASRDRVFSIVERAQDWTLWSDVVADVTRAPAIPWRASEQLAFKLRMAGRRVSFSVRVTEYEQGSKIAWASTKLGITAVRTLSFVDRGICRVADHKRFSSRFLPIGICYPRSIIRRMTDRWLADLKREAEHSP